MSEPTTESHEPIPSFRGLSAVWLALLGATALTVWASTVDLGRANAWIALAIASGKSSLVLAFFMRLRHESRTILLMFVAAVVTLALFIGLTFVDVSFR